MSMPIIKASHTKRSQSVTDIIESIALEECALAHILNAEGEEIQKVLCFHNLSVSNIVDINNSVVCVINAVTALEKELKEKLDLFDDCLCDCRRRYSDDDDYDDNDECDGDD